MRVQQLIEILLAQPQDAEVQIAMVGAADDSDDLQLDPWEVLAVLPWEGGDDDDHDHAGHDHDHDHSDELVVFLVGGDPDDVEDFLEAVEPEDA